MADLNLALCCLECKGRCCGPCDECPACCDEACKGKKKDKCKTFAYFKNNMFYTDYTQDASYTHTIHDDCLCIGDGFHPKMDANYNGSYTIDSELGLTACQYSENRNGQTKPGNPLEYLFTQNLETCTFMGKNEDWDPEPYDGPCGPNDGCPCCTGGGVGLDDECTSFVKKVSYGGPCCDHEKDPFGCGEGDPCTSKINITSSAKLNFRNEVKLYNNKGEVVDDIQKAYRDDRATPPTYDPCGPLKIWGAPSCHFFYPGG